MRGRPTLGIPILINMHQTAPNRWEGKFCDPRGTRATKGRRHLYREHHAEEGRAGGRGCWTSFICGGEDWTRITDPNTPIAARRSAATGQERAAAKKAPAPTARDAAPAVDPICSNVARLVTRVS